MRDVVTRIVHNHTSAATPKDVDTHTHHEHREGEKLHGESEEYEDKTEEDHDSEQHGYQDEESGPTCFIEKNWEGGWQTKGKSQGKGQFDRAWYNCGKTGHRSRDW